MTTREINRLLREAAKAGQAEIVLEHPDARHNLGVALLDPVRVRIDGNAGSGVAASIRGGTVVVRGQAAARAGVSMKGGTLVIGGNCGPMAGFMMQKGRIIICGDAADALADSMYEGVVFVGGDIKELGNDAVVQKPTRADVNALESILATYQIPHPVAFRKVVSGRKLWNFDRKELDIWKAAL